ncbi:hypothetical protein C8Q76DRAFT_739893 [Earliella scabrosa]|nr:hypothetical protein C8Q76DRAFT_739893 [Earliella scabrosa]
MNMIASQLFFVRRVFLMGTYHRIFACAATICFVGELAIAVGITVLSFTTAPSSVLNQLVKALYTTASAGDTLITASLITGTYKSRKRASTTSTGTYERIGEFFVTYVINTGMIHNVLNIVALCLSPLEQTLYSPSLSLVITRVYFMTLLTVLNTRTLLVSRGINILDGGDRFGMNIIARAKDVATKEQWNVPQVPDAAPAMININVTTELESPDVGLVSCMSDSASFGDMMGKVDSRA